MALLATTGAAQAQTLDFSDYSSFGSASSTAITTLKLGATTDKESAITANTTATGDDTTGTDDEDGVTIATSVAQGAASSMTVNVTNTSGATAYLNVWIDFNRNGVLSDAGEQVATNTLIATGTSNANNTVNFTVPTGASLGVAGVRVRLTSTSTPGATGLSGNGEVEDYVTTITAPTTDFGDWAHATNPAGAATTTTSSIVSTSLRLGASVDAEVSATTNVTATGDDITGSDDEDGVIVPNRVSQGDATLLVVNVTNTTGAPAYLNAWIDFNGNGVLSDAGEQITTNQVVATGTSNLTLTVNFTVPSNAYLGPVGVRVRLTSTASPGPNGASGIGEVEDNFTTIFIPCGYSSVAWISSVSGSNTYLETYDFVSSAKATIGLTKDSSNVNHALFDLAWAPNGKLYGIEASTNSSVFEVNPSTGALTLIGSVTGTYNGMVFDDMGVPYLSSSANGDIFTFTLSALSTSAVTTPTLLYDSPATAPNGSALTSGGDLAWVGRDLYYAATGGYSKFYLYKVVTGTTTVQLVGEFVTTAGSPVTGVFGLIGDGHGTLYAQAGTSFYEVNKNNAVSTLKSSATTVNTIYGGTMPFDWCQTNHDHGDYSGFGQATSAVLTGLQIGPFNDGEYAVANSLATADDTTGFDDEDGVTPPAALNPGFSSSISISATNQTGAPAYLNAWIDFNRNGVLTDTGEQLTTDQVIATGTSNATITLPFTTPLSVTAGAAGLRVRLSSVSSPGPTGSAGSGEIEDYLITTNNLVSTGNLVWADSNNNGLKDASEAGISNVGLQLFLSGQNPLSATPTATTTTSATGAYQFSGLAPGQYFIYIPTPPASAPLSTSPTVTTDNSVDNDDNGSQTTQGQSVTSPVITLTSNGESIADGDTNSNTDLTLDFGFRTCPAITISPATLA
ncbi:MAG: beta strand repeat-containing protein, partial [Prosthecobacter sp.]|uniref:beta strand repeat-containing protein n=1 Tax=Prosthecobacter sp. TaxID=1965333 RepID=UPI003903C99F